MKCRRCQGLLIPDHDPDATTAYKCQNCGNRPKDSDLDQVATSDHGDLDGVTIGEPRCEWEFPDEPLRICEDAQYPPSRYCKTHRAAYWRALEERTILKPTKDRVSKVAVAATHTTNHNGGTTTMVQEDEPRRRGRPPKQERTGGAITDQAIGALEGKIGQCQAKIEEHQKEITRLTDRMNLIRGAIEVLQE